MLTQLTHHDASALGIGLNFPIFISTMAVNVFHADARGFGLLSSIMAIGTISGALLAAASRPRFGSVVLGNSAKSFPVTIRSRDLPFRDLARDSTAICCERSARWTYAEPLMTYVGGTALPSCGTPVPDRGII